MNILGEKYLNIRGHILPPAGCIPYKIKTCSPAAVYRPLHQVGAKIVHIQNIWKNVCTFAYTSFFIDQTPC